MEENFIPMVPEKHSPYFRYVFYTLYIFLLAIHMFNFIVQKE